MIKIDDSGRTQGQNPGKYCSQVQFPPGDTLTFQKIILNAGGGTGVEAWC